MSYATAVAKLAPAVSRAVKRDRPAATLKFGGPTRVPDVIRVPTHADTKFQAEQALGKWAENTFAAAVNRLSASHRAVHYGFNNERVAGDPGFSEEYKAGIIDTSEWGKRPDLLLVGRNSSCPTSISDVPTADAREYVKSALGAIEVRSSRHETIRHRAYKAAQRGNKPLRDQDCSSFTVKIEDLIKVYRWIEVHDKPQIYAQVFLDEIYGLSVRGIMEYIANSERLNILEPKRSHKVTVMIPVTRGALIGTVSEYPTLSVVDRRTPSGRHDMFVKPSAGEITLDMSKLISSFAE